MSHLPLGIPIHWLYYKSQILEPSIKLGVDLGLLLDPNDLVDLDGVLSVTEFEFSAPEPDGNCNDGEDQSE